MPSWRNNCDDLTIFFLLPLEIRKIIYTRNLIENLNGKIRIILVFENRIQI